MEVTAGPFRTAFDSGPLSIGIPADAVADRPQAAVAVNGHRQRRGAPVILGGRQQFGAAVAAYHGDVLGKIRDIQVAVIGGLQIDHPHVRKPAKPGWCIGLETDTVEPEQAVAAADP